MAKPESDDDTNLNSNDPPANDENMSEGSDSDSDSDDQEEKLKEQAQELQSRIKANKYSYDDYVNLLQLLQKMVDLTGIRQVYKDFSDIFPLTTSLWLDWINVEKSIATSESETKAICDLFEKAVLDYLSVDLWMEYVKFCLDSSSVEDVRRVFEKAVSASGLHVAKGSLLWDSYREFELAHLAAIQAQTPNSFDDTWLLQAQRVTNVYRRQLSVPLLDMDKTYIEFRVWAERLPRKDFIKLSEFESVYKKASDKLNDIEPLENKLLVSKSDNEKLDVYNEYLEYEKSNPIRLNILYERAVSDIPLNGELWLRYCKFATQLGPESFALSVCHRSVRNCMWTVELWIHYLISLELFQRPQKEVTDVFEKALQNCYSAPAHKQLWLFYLEYSRRKFTDGTLCSENKMEDDNTNGDEGNDKAIKHLRSLFSQAYDFVINTWGVEGDPGHTILQFWARTEANFFHDFEETRKLWRDILSNGNNQYAFIWMEYLKLELRYGDPKHIRKSFLRSIQTTKDWPNIIAESWLNYERDYGTLESLLECQEKCKSHLETWNNSQAIPEPYEEKTSKKKNANENKTTNSEQRKRKSLIDAPDKNTTKKVKQYHKELESLSELRMEEDHPESKPHNEFKEPPPMDTETESRTLFISNLDYTVTEDDLKSFFGDIVKSIRLVKDYKGRSKGYAYLELNTKDDAENTLKRDRERLLARPVFVSRCKTEKVTREKVFKYSTKREQHKLFIKNLPLSLTQEQLESIFSPYGKIKDTRMVCYRNGHFKGLAYVEYENASDAAKAVLKSDGQVIDNHAISVSISDPPMRQQKDKPVPSSLGSKEPLLRKSRLQMPLLPSVLQRAGQSEESSDMKPKSNEDFRQMLLKGGT